LGVRISFAAQKPGNKIPGFLILKDNNAVYITSKNIKSQMAKSKLVVK
jgi:hypothetical protein